MKFFFPLLYVFSILSYYGIGQVMVPGLPINLNILSIILLFFACLLMEKPKIDKWMVWYFVFLLFYAFSSLATGFFGGFFHRLYSFFFMSFVIYWATGILIRRFCSLSPLLYTVLAVAVIDVIVTVSQAYGMPIRNPFITMMIQNAEQDEFLASHGYELGYSISGLYTSPVWNGHNLLFFFLISLLPQYDKLNVKMLLFTFFIFVGIFFCQQRSAFIFSLISFVLLFYNRIKKGRYRVLLFFFFIIITIALYSYLSDFIVASGSRLSQTTDTGREIIWQKALTFIINHPFLGGYDLCTKVAGIYSHNLILSAFIAGGLIGGIVLLSMISGQIVYIIRKISFSNNMLYYIVGIMYFCILGDSMLHNTGLVDMDFSTFIVWGLFSTIMKDNISPNISLIKRKKNETFHRCNYNEQSRAVVFSLVKLHKF